MKVSHDLTKNLKSCIKLKIFFTFTLNGGLPLCVVLRQREVNQNSQVDQSQAGIDVNRRQADQANRTLEHETLTQYKLAYSISN